MDIGGGVVMYIAATKNAGGLIAARFFLRVPESGIGMKAVCRIQSMRTLTGTGSCVAFYYSFWYTQPIGSPVADTDI